MKARFLNDGEAVNPLCLESANPEKEGIVPLLVIPAGTVTEDPDCWMLCTLGVAAPEDDECREAVFRFLGSDKRRKLLDQIRSLIKADGVQQLDAKTKKWLDHMRKSYAAELEQEKDSGSRIQDSENT